MKINDGSKSVLTFKKQCWTNVVRLERKAGNVLQAVKPQLIGLSCLWARAYKFTRGFNCLRSNGIVNSEVKPGTLL